jgi:hypothetical protein
MSNDHKAARGAEVFEAYAHDTGAYPYHEQAVTMAKLLADLMHFADEWKFDFASCVAQAQNQLDHDREVAFDEELAR